MKKIVLIILMLGWIQLQGSEASRFDPAATAALFAAIERKDIEGVQRSLSMGADPNGAKSNSGDGTPLTWAAAMQFAEAIEILVQKGAIIDQPEKKGWAPLVLAATGDDEFAVKVLLDLGANVHVRNSSDGLTPLITPTTNLKIIRMLLDAGANVNAKSSRGFTALIGRASYAEDNPQQTKDAIQLLLDSGADVNAKNEYGLTALDYINQSLAKKYDSRLAEIKDLLIQAAQKQQAARDGAAVFSELRQPKRNLTIEEKIARIIG